LLEPCGSRRRSAAWGQGGGDCVDVPVTTGGEQIHHLWAVASRPMRGTTAEPEI